MHLYRFIITLLVVTKVSGLKCYSCTASLGNHYKCENISGYTNQIPYNTCIYPDSVCAKFIVKYEDSVMIHRNCHHKDICEILYRKYNNFYSSLVDCHICANEDYCNSAEIPQVSLIVSSIFKIVLVFVLKSIS